MKAATIQEMEEAIAQGARFVNAEGGEIGLDTNILIRYLRDDERQWQRTTELLSDEQHCCRQHRSVRNGLVLRGNPTTLAKTRFPH